MKLSIFAWTFLWLELVAGSPAWFHSLPDERFQGVPSILVRLEKEYPAIKKAVLKMVGKTAHSKNNVNNARRQRVVYFEFLLFEAESIMRTGFH